MTMHPSMSYRITTLELEQAAVRAERARMAAEHADQIVRRDGILRRALRRLQNSPATATAVRPAVPAAPVPATATAVAEAPVARLASATVEASTAGAARDRELVGCAPHAA